jgi:hypothetical protein
VIHFKKRIEFEYLCHPIDRWSLDKLHDSSTGNSLQRGIGLLEPALLDRAPNPVASAWLPSSQ